MLFFKRFITVLFASNKKIKLLKRDKTNEKTIVKSVDISYDENMIENYYSGMKLQNDPKQIIGFTWIITTEQFWKTKREIALQLVTYEQSMGKAYYTFA